MTPKDKSAHDLVIKARTQLLLHHPFFGALALLLKEVEECGIPTCATDGTRFYYNPDFWKSLSGDERLAVFAHEVLHCTNGHPWREGGREHVRWNCAADYAINPIIVDAKMTLPKDCLIDQKYSGMSAEQIYNKLPVQKNNSGDGGRGNCGIGEVMPAPSGGKDDKDKDGGNSESVADRYAATDRTKSDWEVAAVQAAQAAKLMGNLPGSLERLIDEICNPKVNWKEALSQIVQQHLSKDDYSWTMPNNRFIPSSLYMPSLRSERVPTLVVVVDTSGSIGAKELSEFGSEVSAIAGQCKPEKVYVLYVDTRVSAVEEYLPGDAIELTPKGGGGTDMPAAYRWIEENGVEPACCIFLTDGYTPWGEQPEYPVVWAINTDQLAPYGTCLDIRP